MAVVAKLRHLHIAPRKVRLAADLIRGKPVEEAQAILNFTVKKASIPLLKLLRAAVANAKNNFQLSEDKLYISKVIVNEGPKYKRWQMRARGRASELQKKTSHITIELDEFKKEAKKIIKKPEISAVAKIEKSKSIPEVKKPKTKHKFGARFFRPKTERGPKREYRRKAF